MKLRTKTLLMVGLTLVGLLVGVFISAKVIVLGGFEDLEREAVRLRGCLRRGGGANMEL